MKGSYNAVTQEASGEYSRVDYQEGRKNTLLTGGIAIAVLAVIGVIIWYVLSKVTSIVPDPVKTVTDAYTAGTTAVVKGSNSVTKDPLQAINVDGNPYPVKTNTLADYETFIQNWGILGTAAKAGTVITPPAILQAASTAGAESAQTVNRLGLNNAYVNLDPVSQGLVTVGEGVGKVFGIDLIQLGYDMRAKTA